MTTTDIQPRYNALASRNPHRVDFDTEIPNAIAALQARDDSKARPLLISIDVAANNWQICACGELCEIIPRRGHPNGRPIDAKLCNLGHDFMSEAGTAYKGLYEPETVMHAITRGEAILALQNCLKIRLDIEARAVTVIAAELEKRGLTWAEYVNTVKPG